MTKQQKSLIQIVLFLTVLFGGSYLWRRYRDNDIKEHSEYAFGRIQRKTSSLKNGNHWHYEFYFHDTLHDGYWPTHVDYDVHIGDYILINFSSKDPEHNKPLYQYKLKQYEPTVVKQTWDTIPKNLTINGRKQ